MAKESILIVEDEKNILELVKYNLEKEGFSVFCATTGDNGLEDARKKNPALIILDLMLPGLDGIEVCKILKQNYRTSQIPIIMLTAKAEEMDKIVGLELGADDYMTKPFSPRELIARVKAVLRRGREKKAGDEILRAGLLEVDTAKYQASFNGKILTLTSKEYSLLKILMESGGRALSRETLLKEVWGYQNAFHIETRTVDMHIGQLRKKIKNESSRIITVPSIGYRFNPE